jgi:predicted RNA binding protein YcfA (HicA-like mRNA interferase family)
MATWSSEEVGKFLESLGFTLARREGHDTYVRSGHPRIVSVPRTAKHIAPGTLSAILRQARTDSSSARAWKDRAK